MIRGYRMRGWLGFAIAAALWIAALSPATAQELIMTGSRYSAPLWTWIAAIAVAAGLSVVGLLIGFWFLRKRSRLGSSE